MPKNAPPVSDPPNNPDAERNLLGGLLSLADFYPDIGETCSPEDFYDATRRAVYSSMLSLIRSGRTVDVVTVAELLKARETFSTRDEATFYLLDLLANTTPRNLRDYGSIISGLAVKRKLVDAAGKIATTAMNGAAPERALSEAQSLLAGISANRDETLRPVGDIVSLVYDQIAAGRQLGGDGTPGITSGFLDVDQLLDGFRPGDLSLVAGRPGMGKTSFLLAVALHVTRRLGKRTLFFNLEMDGEQLVQRILSAMTRIDSKRIQRRQLSDEEMPRFLESVGRLAETPLLIDDDPILTVSKFEAKCRREQLERGVDFIILDYVQLLESERKYNNKVAEQSEISRRLKLAARSLGVPVLAAAQLSRAVESRKDKRPMLSDLRDSGTWEQDASVVAFLYRDEYYYPDTTLAPNVGEVIIAKNRHGATGTVDLYWNAATSSFRNLERKEITLPRLNL